jgi:integrase
VIRRHWHALFGWASRAGMSAGNPAAGIAVVRIRKSRTEIYTPEQAAALLMHARELRNGRMLPYVVLGLFAGIRPEELLRLRWADVRPDYILVGPDVAKIQGRERHVEVNPTLAAWLSVCRRDLGPVYPHAPMTLRRDRDELVGRSGVTWLQDGMRHSYGSYLYASTKDISRVMANLGHTRPETFSRHYQANVSPARSEQYWALAPERVMVGRREVYNAG